MAKVPLVVIGCFMFLINSQAQVNLVTNPSFEELSACPTGVNQVYKATGWDLLLTGGGGTPDLYHVCCQNYLSCGVPINMYSFQNPHSGSAFTGLHAATASVVNKREYIQSKLLIQLHSGNEYCVAFYLNLWDTTNVPGAAIKTMGAYFDNGEVVTLSNNGLAYATVQQAAALPQVYNSASQLSDMSEWMKVEGSFIAGEGQECITLGNFFPDSACGLTIFDSTTLNSWVSYYYIDDVSVIDISTPAYAGNDTAIYAGDSVFIGRPPETGFNEDCIWLVNGTPIDTVAGLWVKPDTATTYVLQQSICGNISYDTVTITLGVDTVSSVFSIEGNHRVKLFPNPNNGTMVLEYALNKGELGIMQLYDVTGKEVAAYELGNTTNRLAISNTTVQNGVYTCRITVNGSAVESHRVVVIK